MTFQPTLHILAASIAIALAGAALAQAPAAPSPAPAPAATTTPAPATTTTPAAAPAPATAPKAGTSTSKSKSSEGSTRRTTTSQGKAVPAGTPNAAGAPGTTPPGGTPPARAARKERAPSEGGGRQLQNAYADLMTPEEMAAHRTKAKQVKTYAECRTLFDATGKDMEVRAKAQGKSVKATPTEICDKAKERGRFTG